MKWPWQKRAEAKPPPADPDEVRVRTLVAVEELRRALSNYEQAIRTEMNLPRVEEGVIEGVRAER